MGGEDKRKDRKTWKIKREEEVVSFSPASLYPARNGRQSPRVKPGGYTTQSGGKPRESVSSKTGRTSKTTGPFQILSRKTRII